MKQKLPLTALIVAHGAPADPAPQQAAMADLACRVAALLPGWQVAGSTLAAPGALEAAIADVAPTLIYPFFMAEGWFTRVNLPRRLHAVGVGAARVLPAFGTSPGMADLLATTAQAGATAAGLTPAATTVLLAAHGSQGSPASAEITETLARNLAARGLFRAVTTGFLEQAPHLAQAARGLGPALCLPFFALRASHVARDLPEALAEAGFTGPLLPEIGAHPDTPALIAAALRAA